MTGPVLELRDAGYAYPGGAAVGPVDLTVRAGERVLLTGRSGCGKSTLLRLAAGLLQRHGSGEVRGAVRVGGEAPEGLLPARRSARVAFVAQDPADQLVTGSVADELAFGPESAGWAPERIEARIAEVGRWLGLDLPPERDPRALSGGQQQRLVVASALAVGSGLLLLDEPLAQLDPGGAAELLDRLDALAADGVAVVLVEHRLEACLPWADRVVVLDGGRVVHDGPAEGLPRPVLADRGLRLPFAPPAALVAAPEEGLADRPVVASVIGLTVDYGEVRALDAVDLEVRSGERVALLGPNGAGKSTLLGALSGRHGRVELDGRVVDVPQDPDLSLFCPTVAEELGYGPREARRPTSEVEATVREVAAALSVDALLDRPPQALSRGQRLRVAVAAALACRPELLLLDEPTAGQDHAAVTRMMTALCGALGEAALVLATHDVELALRYATRIVVLRRGRVVFDDAPWRLVVAPEAPVPLPPIARWCRSEGIDWRRVG